MHSSFTSFLRNILHVGKTSDKENVCKDRGQEIRTSELIKLYYFYYYWGADNRTLYFNVEVTPEREYLGVCLQDGALNITVFFIFLPQSHTAVVWFSLSDPRVHVRTRVVSPLLLHECGQNGSLIVIFIKSPQDPTIKTNRPRVLFPQQWRHENPPLPPRE